MGHLVRAAERWTLVAALCVSGNVYAMVICNCEKAHPDICVAPCKAAGGKGSVVVDPPPPVPPSVNPFARPPVDAGAVDKPQILERLPYLKGDRQLEMKRELKRERR